MGNSVNIDLASEVTLQQAIEKFWEAFPAVWNLIRSHLRLILAQEFSITLDEFHTLRNMRRGFCSVSQLADVLQVSRPAASQSVEALVEKGLVSRHYDTKDRRHIRLELTDAGKEMLAGIFLRNRGWMVEKMAVLSPEEVARVAKAMDAFKEAFLETGA
jgi:DNA-binding MarR family transcriptional regulator